ncbi:hypothetical protein GDO78_008902 [Eleutherodactylus coqui]|uniref:Uncharacterized protein n=1 Tax=Eleutherodactylus coqui TaxID=57060 RepID=A0A8J6KEL6_ELECQ|nr:hypothetical protein GDO78_008902 [Eleutherodactylus coqui]
MDVLLHTVSLILVHHRRSICCHTGFMHIAWGYRRLSSGFCKITHSHCVETVWDSKKSKEASSKKPSLCSFDIFYGPEYTVFMHLS